MSDRVRRGACPTSHKVCYHNRAAAKQHVRRANMAEVSVYKCDDCQFFHIGGWGGLKDRAAHREHRAYYARIAREHGLTHQEIADAYGITEAAVRGLIKRAAK